MSKEVIPKRLSYLSLSLFVIAIDQLSKYLANKVGLGMVNQGGVFGVFPSDIWTYFLPLVLLWLALEWWRESDIWRWWGMGLLWAGGVSNWLDRLFYGGVFDFIYYPVFGFYGNIADVILGIGVGVLIGGIILRRSDGRHN